MNLKKSLKIPLKILLMIGIALLLFITYLISPYNQSLNQQNINNIISAIQKSKPQHEKLITLYHKINDKALEKSLYAHAWDFLWQQQKDCPCFDVARRLYRNKHHPILENDFAIASKIEQSLSRKDCLNFIFEDYYYLYGIQGVEDAAVFYFQQPIEKLNETELISLLVLQKNPALYHPKKFKNKLDAKVEEIKKSMN